MTASLMEEVAAIGNLLQAFRKVRANRGAPGPDGVTVTELGKWLADHVEYLRRELLEGRYSPQSVRGVNIPKPGGGERMLGIPNVLDRLAQEDVANMWVLNVVTVLIVANWMIFLFTWELMIMRLQTAVVFLIII